MPIPRTDNSTDIPESALDRLGIFREFESVYLKRIKDHLDKATTQYVVLPITFPGFGSIDSATYCRQQKRFIKLSVLTHYNEDIPMYYSMTLKKLR